MKVLSLIFFLSFSQAQNIDIPIDEGKVTYVDFWASWCAPCKVSFPWMKKMHDKYHDKGLVIYAVNLDEDKKDAERFLKNFPNYPFNYVYDPENKSLEKYNIGSLPTVIIYNKEGEKAFRHTGFQEKLKEKYEKEVRSLLD